MSDSNIEFQAKLLIDDERLALTADLLKKKIAKDPLQKEPDIRFDNGFFLETEGYKYCVYKRCRDILDFDHWTTDMFSTTEISDRVLQVFKEGNNLINFYTNDFRERIERNPAQAQKVIYDIYRGTDDHEAFDNFTKFFGRQYSKTSFLFFLKDRERYLPIKPELFRDWFKLLNIDTGCTYGLTWNHYMEFVDIIGSIRDRLGQYFAGTINLLDAHSFVWCMYMLQQDFSLADSDYEDYSNGVVHITQSQWEEVLRNGVLKNEHLDTLYKFYLSPDHTATCSQIAALEQQSDSLYVTSAVEMGKAVAEYLHLPTIQDEAGTIRWWAVLFLGRRLLDTRIEWRIRPELVSALEAVSQLEIEDCEYRSQERQAQIIDDEELRIRAKTASERGPAVYHTEVRRIRRNPDVVEWAKRRENGTCLLCGNEGPFKEYNSDRAFLEVHHIVPLADGGTDSIYNVAALCPNCHRKMHHDKNPDYEEELQLLKDCMEDFKIRDRECDDSKRIEERK